MNEDLRKLDVVSLKAAFIDAAICKIGSNLFNYSASIEDNKIFARIVVFEDIEPSEEDDVMDILGDIVGHFPDVSADFQLVKVQGKQLMFDNDTLPIKLFHRAF